MMNPADVGILHFLDQFAEKSQVFDRLVFLFSSNWLLQGGIVMAPFWWGWFSKPKTGESDNRREFLAAGTVLSITALVVARTLALSLPFRTRPRYVPSLHFHIPAGSSDLEMIHWSSFPSDHAVLFFALATCVFFIARKLGVFLFVYVSLVICLPRIYLGIHFPSDILAGAVIGIGIASLAQIKRLRMFIASPILRWHEAAPGSFYSCAFLSTFMLASEFDPLRSIVSTGWKIVRGSAFAG